MTHPVAVRHERNPLIVPADIPPTRDDLEVTCVMNAGALKRDGITYLMLRVDERPIQENGYVSTVIATAGELQLHRYELDTPDLDVSDSRAIMLPDGQMLITVLSHLRLARSMDGAAFTIDEKPAIFPQEPWEAYAAQDARLTEIDGTVYINYSAVSDQGVATALASTVDFKTYTRHGIVFLPDNRNVCIFPRRINDMYWAMSRPMHNMTLARHSIWLSRSPDLHYWGDHVRLMTTRLDNWDSFRVGGGAPPIETDDGWLIIYHGASADDRYCLGAALLDIEDPTRVIGRLDHTILEPEADYETRGFFGNVVFTDGAVIVDDTLRIYYGASDEVTCRADIDVQELLNALKA